MKKRTFLKNLKKQLESLEPNELEEIIQEYEKYINEKIESGKTEEEAVASFGEVNELAKELLKSNRSQKKEPIDPIGDFSKKAMDTIEKLGKEFKKKSSTEIFECIIEILILIFIIAICKIPVTFLIEIGQDIFNILSNPLNRIFYLIWKFVLEFSYAILAILTFITVFQKLYLKQDQEEKETTYNHQEILKKEKETLYEIGEFIIKIGVGFLKFLAVFLLFGIVLFLIGMTLILSVCLYLLIEGIQYYGIYLVMLALFLLGTSFFSILYHFVINKKNHRIRLSIFIIFSVFLLIGGCGIAVLEVAQTEFINGVPNDLKTEVLTEELTMTKDTVFIGNIAHYNIDNSLENIRVDYEYYPLGTTMSTAVRKEGNFVYLGWNLKKIHISSELLKHMMNDLKAKKVYNYYIEPTIIITASEENIARIKKNRQAYYETETNYTSCEFTRTYTVEMIKPLHDDKESIIVLSEYLEDDITSVHLKQEWVKDLEVGGTYEFTFASYQRYIDTDIEDIFLENEIIDIKKTDKVGMAQRQDNSCTKFY